MRKQKSIQAYFTVEASLLLPTVIGSIVFVICFLLFWYDRCLMEQDLTMLAVKAVQSDSEKEEDVSGELRKWKSENLTEKYYAWQLGEAKMSKERNWIEIKREGWLWMGDRIWKAKATGGGMQIHPVPYLRTCRKLRLSAEENG